MHLPRPSTRRPPIFSSVLAGGCIATAALMSPGIAAAGPADDVCQAVERTTNTLADFTRTECQAISGNKKGYSSFLLLSRKPVLANEASKKAWLLVACAAAGSALNKRQSVRADEIVFTDPDRAKQGRSLVAPAATCKKLQQRAQADQLTLENMYATLSADLKEMNIKR